MKTTHKAQELMAAGYIPRDFGVYAPNWTYVSPADVNRIFAKVFS